jgi:pSer/pThr/pTyr-binding forkhead associated (FHA) protein
MRLLKIGRDNTCDIVLHSAKASSLHAEITILNNGDILLEDKNSTNGTFIMNSPIKPGVQVNIKRGDAIRFADVELLWEQVPLPEDNSNFKAVYGIGTNFRNDIQISGSTVSRFHATLKIDRKNKAYIIDHSKNGTTINGLRISPGTPHRVKKSDAVVCGGVPVNLTRNIPGPIIGIGSILKIAACILVVCGVGFGVYSLFKGRYVDPKTTQAMENASAIVHEGFYYEVTIDDDPFRQLIKNWPEKFYVGEDYNISPTSNVKYFQRTGTAFFISKDGDMGTNRHVAVPWEYRTDKEEEIIRQAMENFRTIQLNGAGGLGDIINHAAKSGVLSVPDAISLKARFQNSPITISGRFGYFGIGLTGSKINSIIDLQQAQVIAESGDPQKDVAQIRLNSRKTPDYIIKMGAICDLKKARVDERSLKPQDETFTIVGYPKGETVSDQTFDGHELRPTMHKATLSKIPDNNMIQIQTVGIGGQSGSPVYDEKHRLVAVLCSGFENIEVTYCCNIKHLIDLYEKNKVRE